MSDLFVPNKGQYDELKELCIGSLKGENGIEHFESFLLGWFHAKAGADRALGSYNAFLSTVIEWENEFYE